MRTAIEKFSGDYYWGGLSKLFLLLILIITQAACGTMRYEEIVANAEPMSKLDEVKKVYLVRQGGDAEIEKQIDSQLAKYGYEIVTGENQNQAEMLVYYTVQRDFHITGMVFYIVPVGHEDIRMVRLVFREPATGYALASASFSQVCASPLKANREAEEIVSLIFSEIMNSYEKHK